MKKSLLFLVLLSSLTALGAQSQVTRAETLIRDMEAKINLSGQDLTSTFTLVQKKQGEADRVLKIKVYRRDTANKFTLVFQFPDSEKGKGYYRSGDDLYLYLPTTREFVYRNRKDDVGSTDVRTDLFARSNILTQYNVNYLGQEKVAKFDTDVVELTGKTLDVSFPYQKWYLRTTDGLPVKVENFSASKTLLRTFYYVNWKPVGNGQFLFTQLMAVNNLENNQRTLLSNEDITTGRIPDYVFSQAFLEEQSR